MDHQYIEDHDVVGRYLQRALDLDEHARFEQHFVDCPECLDRLALAEMFRESQRNHAAAAAPARSRPAAVPPPTGWIAKLSRLPRGQQSFLVILAAVTLAGAPSAFFLGRSLGVTRDEGVPPVSGRQAASIRILRPSRAGETANEIVLDRATAPLVLMLPDTAGSGGGVYRLTLRTYDGTTVWAESGIGIPQGASVGLSLPPGSLPDGTYILFLDAMENARGDSPVAQYRLHIGGNEKR